MNISNRKIIKASAGTGKTYRLALEYISRLLLGDDYKSILFMTFTRSATAELKARIFEFLDQLCFPNSEIEKNIKELYPEVTIDSDYVKYLKKQLLLNRDKIKIFTIDSFIGHIFKKTVGPYLNIYAYENINQKESEDIYNRVFTEIIISNNFDKINTFLGKNSSIEIEPYLNLIQKICQDRWKFNLISKKKPTKNSDILKDELYKEIVELFCTLNELVERGKILDKCLGPSTRIIHKQFRNDLSNSTNVINFIMENKNKLLEKYFDGRQTKKIADIDLKKRLIASQKKIINQINELIYITEILVYEQEIIEIEKIVKDIYNQILFKEKKLAFSDITNLTSEYILNDELDLVKKGVVTPNFYEIIGGEITTLFLDEAQDTSVSQWRIIEPIAINCKNIIVVGDEKQSIYSWRGGDKGLFLSMGKILNGQIETLPTNYRSEKEIMDFVNFFFNSISSNYGSNEDGDEKEYNSEEYSWEYRDVKCSKKDKKGYVAVMVNSNIYYEIATDIKSRFYNIDGTSDYRSIGIIAKGKKELNNVGEELKKIGVPYITQNSLSIVNHPCVVEILKLLHFFIHRDFISLLEFFKVTIKIDEDELKFLLKNRYFLIDYLRSEDECKSVESIESIEYTEISIKNRFKNHEFILFHLDKIKKIKNTSFNNLGEIIILEYEFLEKYSANRDIKNINFFLELMGNHDYLICFLDFLNANSESEELRQIGIVELNSVVLMTIHKSKGLDFHTEYMCLKDKTRVYSLDNEVNLMTKLDSTYEKMEDYLFTNSKYDKNIKKLNIYKHMERVYSDEAVNVLYVGMTRPRANLILCIEPSKVARKDEFILKNDLIITPIEKYFNVSKEELLKGGLISSGIFIKYKGEDNSLYNFKLDLDIYKKAIANKIENQEIETYTKKINITNEIKRQKGLAAHYYLENIEYASVKEIDIAKKLVLNKFSSVLGKKETLKIIKYMNRFLVYHNYVFDEKWTVFRELELNFREKVNKNGEIRLQNNRYIIDRLNVNSETKEIIIYDYKTGDIMNIDQLNKYEKIILNQIGSEYKVIEKRFLKLDFDI